MITLEETNLKGVLLIKPSIQEDFRGSFTELYNEELYNKELGKRGLSLKFVQEDISISTKNVLRGIHGDFITWKLITCIHGKLYFVVANCKEDSDEFGKWQGFVLSDANKYQVLVSPEYGMSYFVLSDEATFHYKQTTYYNDIKDKQYSIRFDDKRFNIIWPISNPRLSKRDRGKYAN